MTSDDWRTLGIWVLTWAFIFWAMTDILLRIK